MLNRNDEIKVKIDDLSIEGSGIGKYNGMAVFVPRALPGEIVSAKIIKVSKSYCIARLMDINEKSKHRTVPFCAVFETCGGCTLQHLEYEKQLAFKSRHIQSCLKRLGGIDADLPTILAAENVRDYRNKASFPVAEADGKIAAGFFASRSHRLVACDCPIQKDVINEIKNVIIKWARENGVSAYDETKNTGVLRHIVIRQTSKGEVMAGVVVREKVDEATLISALKDYDCVKSIIVNKNKEKGNAILGSENRVIFGDAFITENYEDNLFNVGLSSFLQVNHEQSEKLYQIALDLAEISRSDIVFDLFCGIGTISLLAAKRAKTVLGIEYEKSAVDNANENARMNGIENVRFIAGDAGTMIEEGIRLTGKPDILILDPPRKGCDTALIDKIISASPRTVVYVSCDPATLSRDTAIFCKNGYMIKQVQGIDMFPYTTHVETVVLMSMAE